MEKEKLKLLGRALIGGIQNQSSDCIEALRPYGQYMHFFRESKKKVNWILGEDGWGEDDNILGCLKKIQKVYKEYPKIINQECIELSKKLLGELKEFGYEPRRNITL